MNRGGGRFNFPNWNYGYTLGPPEANGGYSEYFGPQFPGPYGPGGPMPGYGGFGMRGRGGRPFHRGGRGGPRPSNPGLSAPPSSEVVKEEEKSEVKSDDKTEAETKPEPEEEGNGIEEGQIVERPMQDILQGRHPIVFCNEQSKYRHLPIEWEQISETGPPHDKTFTWSLKMGEDLVTIGVANNKKGAKSKAAEEMAKKLDALPQQNRPRKRSFPPPFQNYYNPQFNTNFQMVQHSLSKKRKPAPETTRSTEQSELDKKSQNNPISKLYELCRQHHWSEPLFETVSENVLETRKSSKGFTMRKTEFTMQCEVQGKKFVGSALNKKEAKYNAATQAWAEFGVGVNQTSISDLLQSHRDGPPQAETETS